jgi:hypothetical protein
MGTNSTKALEGTNDFITKIGGVFSLETENRKGMLVFKAGVADDEDEELEDDDFDDDELEIDDEPNVEDEETADDNDEDFDLDEDLSDPAFDEDDDEEEEFFDDDF